MRFELDHIAVCGETLEEAAAHTEAALGVPMLPGGHHARFGTHNQLQGLEDGLYLEAIAIDPAAEPPSDKRWFGLSDFEGPPRLGSWVCRVDDIEAAVAALPEAGPILDIARGALSWRITVPESGLTPFGGMFPTLIQWNVPVPPGKALPSSGCRLLSLEVAHPEAAALGALLAPYLEDDRLRFETRSRIGLTARFETGQGLRVLQ